jgi:hypothetical protein
VYRWRAGTGTLAATIDQKGEGPLQIHRLRAVLVVPALAAAAVLVATASGASAAAKPDDRAAGAKLLQRFDLDAGPARRASAKRPPRGSRGLRPVRAGAAIYRTTECEINPVFDYFSNSTVKPYTWRTFELGGIYYGYEQFSRWGWQTEYPGGLTKPPVQTCRAALGYQYEWFRWNGRSWVWWTTVNCDIYNRCTTVR